MTVDSAIRFDVDGKIGEEPDSIAARDGNGDLRANNFIGDLQGNALSADTALNAATATTATQADSSPGG